MTTFTMLPRPNYWLAHEWDGTQEARDFVTATYQAIGPVGYFVGDDMYYLGDVVPAGAWIIYDPVSYAFDVVPDLAAFNTKYLAVPTAIPFTGEEE